MDLRWLNDFLAVFPPLTGSPSLWSLLRLVGSQRCPQLTLVLNVESREALEVLPQSLADSSHSLHGILKHCRLSSRLSGVHVHPLSVEGR